MRWQAVRRLLVFMAVITVGIPVVGFNAYVTRQRHEIEQKQQLARHHYIETLPQLEAAWQTQAEQTRRRIEFTRILEGPESVRWAALTTFLTAQWASGDFSSLVILSPAGDVLFRFGSEAINLNLVADTVSGGWYYSADHRELFRLLSTPLWLGQAGQGSLLLFRPMNTSMLRAALIPEVHLLLQGTSGILARSQSGSPQVIEPAREGLILVGERRVIQTHLPWPHPGPLAPTLVVQRDFIDSVPALEFMLRPIAAIAMILLMLWAGLGRWLSRSVRRIESLDAAALSFAGGSSSATAVPLLAPASSGNDEIGDVATTLETLMQRIEERDREQRAYLDTLAMLDEAVLELDATARIVRASPGWNRLTRSDESAAGQPIARFIHGDDADAMERICAAFRTGDKLQANVRLRLLGHSGGEQWVECRLIAQFDSGAKLTGIRGVMRDVTQTCLHEQQITHMALHDALTDLPNRVLLEDRIKIAIRMASRDEHQVAVCFIDLDHFKKINDSLGHKAGDRLLVSFASMLRRQLRAGDTLARWGGDEFVLLLPGLNNEEDAREVTRKIAEALQSPFKIEDGEYTVTFSMGVAMYPADAQEVESLLTHADRAMFYAKTQGRNQTCFFGEVSDKGGGRRELYIQNKLVEAVHSRRIQAWFQPIVSAGNGECQVAEVLARWHDAEFGWVGPATFIPIAESTGIISELGHQIWEQALQALVEWRARGQTLRLAINISKRQLFSAYAIDQLVSVLAQAGLEPSDIVLEVTESIALLDVANASERLEDLQHIGFHIAIDDFGTGYSALSQLHEMPVSELKIDISFVRRLHEPAGQSMTQAIIHLAKALGLETIAEGVEDEATASKLRAMGVDYLQGYHFARPMPRAEFEAWLLGNSR
ncbi:MAG: EAL domain-containing protein [Gammaproteobacteria bacterium]|nr:EAL domain-containing protein [Gammaproteobacteria bacterium]MBU1646360.1 EAL domain-containing protein [Gammaproteobacteria bacterium]MBU1970903.1 EAL domain-containing protein [Gammaproteobacteria bacterium]